MPETSQDETLRALDARCMELEIRSEEGLAEIAKLQDFVGAYERRILRLESALSALKQRVENPPEGMGAAEDEAPPHY